jgi:hypothetical protein
MSNNEQDVIAKRHDSKVYFSARRDTPAANALRNADGPVGFHLFHNVSRDGSLCFNSSISGMTVEIHPERPESLTCAWLALPAKGLALPLFMGCTGTPRPLVDGELYGLLRASKDTPDRWEQAELKLREQTLQAQGRASALLADGKPEEATVLLDNTTQSAVSGWVATLRSED